ncbi:hypothetical protein T4B_7535 [Trichinella pseudospiralis]|uniref:Domain of unknown function DB domain-containing protein n=2 Tax=Trichinella pseudospiralis TaxID=6337 RepID=A0A0V1K6Q4_TRIPS|nr:hypothetical protein T4E_1226 [Trichinella pseudospiralis]KRY74090.1 hypothetical protein T4A_2347 [Trichinella pseudospiralis]KRY87784.1 hypothetical protein T4D_12373 [Trichinella pseudospiralis]KRZ29002.1 hypothetical protein T4B_7535 [Trichinella pseudospiralis]KRZ42881.1 hypothetical protein T4C_5068 [Trichinella pseudospiralis]
MLLLYQFCGFLLLLLQLESVATLSCEKAGCAYCRYGKMQQHCAAFCNSCGIGSVNSINTGVRITKPSVNQGRPVQTISWNRGQEPNKYTRPYNTKSPNVKPATRLPKTPSPRVCNGITPCIPLEEANRRYENCCEERGIKTACINYCRYDISLEEARFAFMHGKCPFRQLQTYLSCAAQGKDRRDCCRKKGILNGSLAFCEYFCAPDLDGFPGAKPKYQPCAQKLMQMMNCFWAGLQ